MEIMFFLQFILQIGTILVKTFIEYSQGDTQCHTLSCALYSWLIEAEDYVRFVAVAERHPNLFGI